MRLDIRSWIRSLAAAGGVALAVLLSGTGRAQTLPIAGDPQEAVAQDRADRRELDRTSGVGGVREQDAAARRTSNELNRDARQEAREAALAGARGNGQGQANARAGGQAATQGIAPGIAVAQGASAQGQLASTLGPLNGALREADLGVQLTNRPGAGLTVSSIANTGVFASAGLRQGDRIISINGTPITTQAQFLQALRTPASQGANIVVARNGQQQTLSLSPTALMQNSNSSLRTAMRPGTTTAGSGLTTNPQTGATTVNQIDRSGLNTLGGVAPATSSSLNTTTPGSTTGTTLTPSAIAPSSTTANPVTLGNPTPTPGNPTSPSLLVQPNIPGGGVATSTPGVPTAIPGAPTAIPSIGGSGALPSINTSGALPPISTSAALPNLNGTTVGGVGTSGLSPANPAVPAFGSAGATGATGTTGGTGSTAGGVGAVGGTGAMSGGAGSTAGPSGGRAGATGAPGGAGGIGAGGAAGAGGGAAAGGGAGAGGGGGGAGAGGT